MPRNSELREIILQVFDVGVGMLPKDVIEAVCERSKEIEKKQVHNFLCNNLRTGLFYKDNEGRYFLKMEGEGVMDMELENKMIDRFKCEIEELCDKYLEKLENPFDKFDGISLLQAKNLYTYIKKVKKSL